ncbi:protein FliT [Kushneria sinocarnis]|uniref:Flagellar protein FliT n=1 Tax=Kushneria sinocarnis TaxID=595502 RepID=A0A420WXV5_9GAMM|nr:flagellar protein FliT [Kushneria sinocarnis]RKR06059.1 protein FliT [Kushneria sinocarnis]
MQTPCNSLLEAFRDALSLNREMLESAHAQQWERLIQLEDDYVRSIQHIRRLEESGAGVIKEVSSESENECREILQQLLANSHTIQQLLDARQQELGKLMSDAGSRRRLENTYASIDRLRS